MKTNNKNTRRDFLRKTTLGAATIVAVPSMIHAKQVKNEEGINEVNDCFPTTLDLYGEGPFYTENPPEIVNGQLAEEQEPGTRLILSGVVRTLDCTDVIANAEVDFWHANDAGAYDNQGYNLRGKTYTNAQGFYLIETILPGKYLNGNSYRPRHIHVKVTPPNYPTLTTQIYFEGDTDIPNDPAASVTSGTYDASHRIIAISLNEDNKYEGTWDVILDGNGTSTAIENLGTNKGVIYDVFPNPFLNLLEVKYGVFQNARVSVEVFDMQGVLVAVLDQRQLKKEKYSVVWNPDSSLRNGVYWLTLKINDLQVSYKKIVKN